MDTKENFLKVFCILCVFQDEQTLSAANTKLEARAKALEAIKAECLAELKNLDKNQLCKGLSALAESVPPGHEDAVVSIKMVLYRDIAGQIKELAHLVSPAKDQVVPELPGTSAARIGVHPQDLVLVPPGVSSSSTTGDETCEKIIITCRPVNDGSTPQSASSKPVVETIPGIIYAGEGTIMVASMVPSPGEMLVDASRTSLPQNTVSPLHTGNQVTASPLYTVNQPSVASVHPENQGTTPPLNPGNNSTVPPLHAGNQATVAPLHTGNQAAPPPLHAGNQATVAPLHTGNQAPPPQLHAGNQAPVSQLHAGNQITVVPLHTGNQPTVAPLHAGNQPTVSPLHAGNQITVSPLQDGNPTSVPSLHTGNQANVPPLHTGNQANVPPLHTGNQATVPPLHTGNQCTVPPLHAGVQPTVPRSSQYVMVSSMNSAPTETSPLSNHTARERPMPILEQSAPIDLSKSTGLKETKKYEKVDKKPDGQSDIQVQEVSQSTSSNSTNSTDELLSSAAMALIDLSNAHALIDLSKTGAMRRLDLTPVRRDTNFAPVNNRAVLTPEVFASNTEGSLVQQQSLDHSQDYAQHSSNQQAGPSDLRVPYSRTSEVVSSSPPKQTSPMDLSKSKSRTDDMQNSNAQEIPTQLTKESIPTTSSDPVIVFVQSLATGMAELPRIDLNRTKMALPGITDRRELSLQSSTQSNIQSTPIPQSSVIQSRHERGQGKQSLVQLLAVKSADNHTSSSPAKSVSTVSSAVQSVDIVSSSEEEPSTSGHSSDQHQLGSPVKLLHKTLLTPHKGPSQPLIGITRKERQRYASKKNRQKNQMIKKALLQVKCKN